MSTTAIERPALTSIEKSPTGITGLDQITAGGIPQGRATLVCGGPGCGKTLMAFEFLVRGATEFGEPGVFIAFEERPEELAANVRSMGFDLDDLIARNLLVIDYVHVDPSEIDETGTYDLEGLFIRIGGAIDAIGAKRLAIDTVEVLYGGFTNHGVLRAELRRLFRFVTDRGVTALVTCETVPGGLSRRGLEEYVSDCVIVLDHRVINQISTRRLRIVKYRGSGHGSDEYPFLITSRGLSVLPITSAGLEHNASRERVTTGVKGLDEMLGGAGLFRGSTVLITGGAGSGKTSLVARVVEAACERGERCLYLAFEESPAQLIRNMTSIGIDLDTWVQKGLLICHAARPTVSGLEEHLVTIHELVESFEPSVVVMDPISSLTSSGTTGATASMMTRLIDFLKVRGVTALFTSLTGLSTSYDQSEVGVSSLVDTWIVMRDFETFDERRRGLHILKSRGMAHSLKARRFELSDQGIALRDAGEARSGRTQS